MSETALTKTQDRSSTAAMIRMMKLTALAVCWVPGGCVTVTAPDKPIVINLNISVTQDVVYRLDGQAKNLIQSNSGIF